MHGFIKIVDHSFIVWIFFLENVINYCIQLGLQKWSMFVPISSLAEFALVGMCGI